MGIALPGGPESKQRTPSKVTDTRAAKFGERSPIPWYERLVLAGLLLVVIGWIALRMLQILLAAS